MSSVILPKYRPLERFWPYAELPEQPTDEELAALDPDLHEALFGAQPRPFSITLVFPTLDVPDFARALELARASAEFRETGTRRRPSLPRALLVERRRAAARSVPDRRAVRRDRGAHRRSPVPYARELWLPLVWFLHSAVAPVAAAPTSNAICSGSRPS